MKKATQPSKSGKVPPVVRWLGAFRRATTLAEAFEWELTQSERQVAAEPLFGGRTRLSNKGARVGLLVDTSRARLVQAYSHDAYTETTSDGRLKATRGASRWATADWRHLAWVGRVRGPHDAFQHGEVTVAEPHYVAIVLRGDISEAADAAVRDFADRHNLPVVRLGSPEFAAVQRRIQQ